MQFVWDEAKCWENIRKHGIDFADAVKIFRGHTLTYADDRFAYKEQRFITIGLLRTTVILVAHTENHDTIRIIHARKAGKKTAAAYFESFRD